jgi:hypothetical protein
MDAFLNKKAWRCGPAMGLWPLDLEPAGIGEAGWPPPAAIGSRQGATGGPAAPPLCAHDVRAGARCGTIDRWLA